MAWVIPNKKVEGKETDNKFTEAVTNFSIELFKRGQTDNVNSLISPLSVYIALAMMANGAAGETLEEFENVLGMPVSEINEYINSFLKEFPNEEGAKTKILNSIWFDSSVNPSLAFKQVNADYFGVSMYKNPFKKSTTTDRVNKWINDNTNGLIDKALDKVDPNDVMYIINTLFFDQKWSNKEDFYKNYWTEAFYMANNRAVDVKYMSTSAKYIANERTTGFIYNYEAVGDNKNFSFVALLPDYNVPVDEYVKTLTGDEFSEMVNSNSDETCKIIMPKFNYEYKVEDLSDSLTDMGLKSAFDEKNADFSKIVKFNSDNLFIGKVTHNTIIDVNEEGTKAGAATIIPTYYVGDHFEYHKVYLNRPFVYAIIENDTKIPLYIGTVNNFEGETVEADNIPKGRYFIEENDFIYELNDQSVYCGVKKYTGNEKEVVIPSTINNDVFDHLVAGIENDVFKNNLYLEKIEMTGNYYYSYGIGDNVFANCPNLKDVYFINTDAKFGKDVFKGSGNVVIHCYKINEDIIKYAKENDLKVEIIELPQSVPTEDEDMEDTE